MIFLIFKKEKERQRVLDEEKKLIDEALTKEDEDEIDDDLMNTNIYFKKFIQLKKYVKRSEARFIELERSNLTAIKQVYTMLNGEQKLRLIRKYIPITFLAIIFSSFKTFNFIANRPKSKSSASNASSRSTGTTSSSNKPSGDVVEEKKADETETEFERNETIEKIEELLNCLLENSTMAAGGQDDTQSVDTSNASMTGLWFSSSGVGISQAGETSVNIAQMPTYTYAELLALYEKEKNFRHDLESTFKEKSKESNKQVK